MSKYFTRSGLLIFAALLILQTFNNCSGQQITVAIRVPADSSQPVEISGRFTKPAGRNFAITRSYAGISRLAERVSDLILEDANGKPVAYKQLIPGEYLADKEIASWRYKMTLMPRKESVLAAHTSWLNGDSGLLVLDDLLPIVPSNSENVVADLSLELPTGWKSSSDLHITSDIERLAIFVAKDPHIVRVPISGVELTLMTKGEWKFGDDDLQRSVAEIYNEYRRVFGGPPARSVTISLMHFPTSQPAGVWEADTRGSNVTIVSSDTAFSTQSVQRLHEQLRHEMFHLWLPNAVNLSGHYDWFYEGFALYESLKIGVALNRIRFDDYLDTLSRAYTFDSAMGPRSSLIEASANRSAGGDADLYARGMIIALFTDLESMRASRGKTNVEAMLRSLFEKFHDTASQTDGNKAVLDVIASPRVTLYVQGTEQIDLGYALQAAGLELIKNGPSYVLKVVEKPDRRQREMLEKLGYNNWRRSNASPK